MSVELYETHVAAEEVDHLARSPGWCRSLTTIDLAAMDAVSDARLPQGCDQTMLM